MAANLSFWVSRACILPNGWHAANIRWRAIVRKGGSYICLQRNGRLAVAKRVVVVRLTRQARVDGCVNWPPSPSRIAIATARTRTSLLRNPAAQPNLTLARTVVAHAWLSVTHRRTSPSWRRRRPRRSCCWAWTTWSASRTWRTPRCSRPAWTTGGVGRTSNSQPGHGDAQLGKCWPDRSVPYCYVGLTGLDCICLSLAHPD